MIGPDPDKPYPFEGLGMQSEKRTVFLKNILKRKNIIVGDYTYYDHPEGADSFERDNVLYHYDFSKEKLIIGKFCAIAANVKFIMASANHKLNGFSTYPFGIFQRGWEKEYYLAEIENRGDTVVGNDVWFGYGAVIMPGVKIGDGAIIGAMSVVIKDVPAYSVAAGNPARCVKKRFSDEVSSELLKLKWWDWPIEKISQNIKAIASCDMEKLKVAAK